MDDEFVCVHVYELYVCATPCHVKYNTQLLICLRLSGIREIVIELSITTDHRLCFS